MRQLINTLKSRIQYLIILPYLLLMILVMLTGSGVAITLVADSWQERFNNQLGQVARNFAETFAQHELGNISYLAQIIFTVANEQTGAPSIATAMRERDQKGLEQAMPGLWQFGQSREDVNQDRVIIFGTDGVSLLDWERSPLNPSEPTRYVGTDLTPVPLVATVLRGQSAPIPGTDDRLGDKYSGLVNFRSTEGQDSLYFFTVAPVYLNNSATGKEEFIGGVLVAQRLDSLLQDLQSKSQAAISTIYDPNGLTRATTATVAEVVSLDMSRELINRITEANTPIESGTVVPTTERDGQAQDPCIDIGNLTGRLVSPVAITRLPACSVNTTTTIAEREYQVLYAPLLIRGVQSGYFSVGLSRDFVISAWSSSRTAVIGVTAALALATIFAGYLVARRITRPLGQLVETADAVTAGDLQRRSAVISSNELGRLSNAFNHMTEHLLQLYTVSRELNRTIEIVDVLGVASSAAALFAPDSEAIALLITNEGYTYYTRDNAPEPLASLGGRQLRADNPLLAALAAHNADDDQFMILTEPQLAMAGLSLEFAVAGAVAAPLYRQRHLSGALLFVHPEPEAFDESQLQSLAVVGNMTVAVLSNAVLYNQVQQEAKQRQAILTSIGDGVVVCDEKGRIVLLNRTAEQILDLPDWRATRPRFADLPLEPVKRSQELFGYKGIEQFRLADRAITLTRAPVIAEDGQPAGDVIVLHDITEAAAIDKAKTDFIATISHELRTPLTVIRGYIELLLRGTGGEKLSADQADLMEQVRARAVDMTDMVNNAIMIANIEAGKLKTELQPQDVELVISMALAPLRAAFDQKQLSISLDLPPDLPPVIADREQLKNVFAQLLDNARRYTDRGGVTVRAVADTNATVQIEFIDTGQGIAPEVLPLLFKRFQRIEGNNSQQRGGGLGLAITKQLIERQGGKVSAFSTPGQGSTFRITLLQANEHSLAVAQSNESASAS